MFLPDINFWLGLTFEVHAHHIRAKQFFDSHPSESIFFCRFTQQGFLRLASNATVFGDEAVRSEHPLSARPGGPEARPDRAWLEHLAGGANAWRGDNCKRRCRYARKLCVYRNAAPAETAKNGRTLSGAPGLSFTQPDDSFPIIPASILSPSVLSIS